VAKSFQVDSGIVIYLICHEHMRPSPFQFMFHHFFLQFYLLAAGGVNIHTAVQWLALLHVWEGVGTSLGPETRYPNRRFLRVSSVPPSKCAVLQALNDKAISEQNNF